jgi:outer membrane protein insertion porin family
MQQFLSRAFILCLFIGASVTCFSQEGDTTKPTSVNPDLLDLENSRIPKDYTISSIKVTGVNYLDTSIITSISGLQVGEKIQMPGGDAFSKQLRTFGGRNIFQHTNFYYRTKRRNNSPGDQCSGTAKTGQL